MSNPTLEGKELSVSIQIKHGVQGRHLPRQRDISKRLRKAAAISIKLPHKIKKRMGKGNEENRSGLGGLAIILKLISG